MKRGDIAKRLFEAANKHAADHHFRLGPGVDVTLQNMAQEAAGRIISTAQATDRSEKDYLAQAKIDFERLIREMIAAHAALPNMKPGEIGELTLREALKRFCPCFPFC